MSNRIKLIFQYSCIAVSFLMGLFSCNDKSEEEKHSLETTLDIMVHQDETIQLFYKLNMDDAYTESLSIKKPIVAKDKFQKVYFKLPPGIKPKNIRIDFGEKPGLDSFRIHQISFSYKELKLVGDVQKLRTWFQINSNISYDSIKDVFHLKPNADGFYDPQINGNETLNKRFVKLFPPDVNDVL